MVAPYEAVSSAEEIEAAKQKGIRFVQLQFTDIMGVVKASPGSPRATST